MAHAGQDQRQDGGPVRHLDDDFGVDAVGQGVVDQPAHQGSALAGDQPVPAQVLPLDGRPGAERVRLRD